MIHITNNNEKESFKSFIINKTKTLHNVSIEDQKDIDELLQKQWVTNLENVIKLVDEYLNK